MNKTPISSEKLKSSFTQAANSLTYFYQESIKAQSEAYLQGQIDALNEILNHCLQNYAGDIRNIPTTSLIEYLNTKVIEYDRKKSETLRDNSNNFPYNPQQNGFIQNKANDQMVMDNQFNK